jgi:hypothetical protein
MRRSHGLATGAQLFAGFLGAAPLGAPPASVGPISVQRRKVFACRLVARDTIEEKGLELQARKRGLADDIIRVDSEMLRRLERDDLEPLLGRGALAAARA